MGIEVNYRTAKAKKEIIDTLIDIHIESSAVLIWQNEDGKRNVTKAKIEAIDFASDSIIFTPFSTVDENMFDQLNVNSTFYLRGNTKSIVFKQDRPAKKTRKGFLQIFIPTEVKMFEKRSEMRLIFTGKNLKATAEIYPGGLIDISTKAIEVDLHNVSLSGMGFFLEKKLSRLFFEKDKIKIIRIGNHGFPRPIYGEIVYTSTEQNNIDRVRIGIRFGEILTTDILYNIAANE
ncbi:MAG: PilZ domain-containing protein [Bacteriovorax sp.]|nr:PilZ domain-containing protein [Bacteriovorax sp.]